MNRLIKLLSLITIVFNIFFWGGCGSEEPPEPQKTVTKKINIKPPATPKKDIDQDSGTAPTSSNGVTKKIAVKPPPSKKDIDKDTGTAPTSSNGVTKKIAVKPPPSKKDIDKDTGTAPTSSNKVKKKIVAKLPPSKKIDAQGSEPAPSPEQQKPTASEPEQSEVMSGTAKETALKKEPKLASDDKSGKVPHTLDDKADPPPGSVPGKTFLAKKDETKPIDTSIENIPSETDALQPPEEDDSVPSNSQLEASPSLITENQDPEQDSEIEEHAPDINNTSEQLLASVKTKSYDPRGGVDPFVPFIKKKEPKPGPTPKPERMNKTPLEMIDIDQLQLVGIIRAPSGNMALVELADGKGYIIHKGEGIGINDGHVAEILADKVVVEEKGVDSHNEPITKERLMEIQKPPGEL